MRSVMILMKWVTNIYLESIDLLEEGKKTKFM